MDNSGFIDSVHKNVIAHITDENFGVGDLASLLGLSTSHTLRKVKAATGKSVNQYIREVRLAEAAKLIKETDFTSAEIAYKVGFSSPSYFNRTFRKRYGITPGEYKTQEISLTKLDSKDIPSVISINKVLNILAISMLLLIGFLIINNAVSKANSKQISIAVLPFKDMSPIESQWFCDGVVEDILSHLSKINELRVISRTSTMQYRDTKKTIPEIAKELKVDYILEGSARQHQNKVVITAQLINAKDEHLWAEDYNENWDNIFKIQKDVAIKIVEELQIKISPEEKERLDHYPTQNLEALKLFQKGNALADERTKKGMEKSIEFYEKAIELDSSYAEAFAEMANIYFIMRRYGFIDRKEGKAKANNYLNKVLKINPNTVRAYTLQGLIYQEEKLWDKAKENFLKAIEINPNDATAHHQLALYYWDSEVPEDTSYHKHMNKALALDPLSVVINTNKFKRFISKDSIQEAKAYFNKIAFMLSDEDINFFKHLIVNRTAIIKSNKNQDWLEMIKVFENAIKEDPKNDYLFAVLGSAYKGINYDHKGALKQHEIAYNLYSGRFSAYPYYYSLLDNKKFSQAKSLLEQENFKSLFRESIRFDMLMDYYYYQENYEKALEIFTDSLSPQANPNLTRVAIFAKQGRIGEVYDHINEFAPYRKAIVFALLEERDSMYYYMNRIKEYRTVFEINASNEFDPYRKEERYKSFLRKNYLPVTHWNE